MPAAPCQVDLLPYADRLQRREPGDIDLAVIHCTELPDLAAARAYAERVLYPESGTGNSGHWYIDRDGGTWQYVPHERIAHHVRGHNPRSVGIELVNSGRWPDWLDSRRQAMREHYPDAQVEALLRLLQRLREELPGLRLVAGHEDLDADEVAASDDPSLHVRRKLDPGPMFPWDRILPACGLQRLLPQGGSRRSV
jgi:N-acetylmuramoyl-L-alanine amidase